MLDIDKVYDNLMDLTDEREYDLRCLGYDVYNSEVFINRWVSEHGQFGVNKVIQGSRTESVPLGEIKKLSEDRKLLFDEQIMSFAMGNSITIEDNNGNRKLMKRHNDEKIDPVSALMDAYVSIRQNADMFD